MLRKWVLRWLFADGDPRLRLDPQIDLLQRELSTAREERDHFRDLLFKQIGLVKDVAATVATRQATATQVAAGGVMSWPRLKARGEALEHQRAVDAKEKYWEEKGASQVS